jgi:Domain of unknown function (DUF5666)
MAEPDQIEFHEHVGRQDRGQPGSPLTRSIPVRIGIVAGSAILFVVGAVAAMGASPSPSGPAANPGGGAVPGTPFDGTRPKGGPLGGFGFEFRGGDFKLGGFREITIGAIDGSSLSLKTDDGWTRTIAVGSSTTITKGGQTIGIGDLKVGDQIVFGESKASGGSYSISAIKVVLPVVAGQVTAVGIDTITITQKGGAATAIHVGAGTTYDVNGNASAKLSDITVGSIVVAEGTQRSDGSLDATAVHGGSHGDRNGGWGGPGFRGGQGDQTKPKASPAISSSAS